VKIRSFVFVRQARQAVQFKVRSALLYFAKKHGRWKYFSFGHFDFLKVFLILSFSNLQFPLRTNVGKLKKKIYSVEKNVVSNYVQMYFIAKFSQKKVAEKIYSFEKM
jgi:hypothetical protein